MKKVLSMFLALVMMLSLATVAFAANTKIALDETKSVSLTAGDIYTYAFTATDNGVYQFTISVNKYSSVTCYATTTGLSNAVAQAGLIYVAPDIADDYGIESQKSATGYFCAKAGMTIKLFIVEDAGDYFDANEIKEFKLNTDPKVSLTVENANLVNTRLGGTYTSKVIDKYYIFVPEKTGYYNFRSFNSDGCDPCIEILGCDGYIDGNDDIGYEEDLNFDLTTYLKKGEPYLINVYDAVAAFFGDTEAEVYFKFKITDGSKIEPEALIASDEKVTLTKGDWDIVQFFVVPSGAALNADLSAATITSSKPRVADAILVYDEDYEEYYVEIEAYRTGRTTVTVELPNGVSCDVKVVVESTFIAMLRNFFSNLFSFANPFASVEIDM